jgi:SPP1 gp7 family putative phage head morphogenesis protein
LNIDKEVDPPTPFDENDFNRFTNDVWIGAVNNQVLPEGIYLKTAKYLRDGIDLAPVVDEVLTADLTNNIYIFSGAKTYQQTRTMTAMLADPELKSNFYKFKEAVKPMFKLYNEDYLQAEYQTAKASARMASDWKRIEADADVLPLLQYQTVGDGRVRPTHQALDNIIRPINDPFWKQYYPPNGWRCRCTVIQLSEGELSDMSNFTPPDDVPPLFRMNSGIDGYVFKERGKDKHPYFDIAKGDKEAAKKNWNLPIPQAPRPAPVVEVPKVFKPATTWEEAVKTMRESGIAYEMDGLSKASLETLNTINKVLIETKSNENVFFDKIKIIKTQAKRQWIPAEHKITLAADGSVLDRTLTVNQGHIDWAINKYGSMENFMSKDNWFAVNSFEGVINHEVGHLVTIGNFNNKSEILEWQKLVSPKRINISGYGKTHGEEALAEIWAVYKVKGKDSLSSEFIDFFNTYSKKYKI